MMAGRINNALDAKPIVNLTIAAIAEQFFLTPAITNKVVQEDAQALIVTGICSAYRPKPQHLAYVTDLQKLANLDLAQIDFLIIPDYKQDSTHRDLLTASDHTQIYTHPSPRLVIAKIAALFENNRPWQAPATYLGNSEENPNIHPSVILSPGSIIADSVSIGENTYIGPNVTIEPGVTIGANSVIQGNNYIGDRVEIGSDCWIHPGAVIGSEGFGLVPGDDPSTGVWQRVPHLGTVIIGDRVEIGANTTIDRGAIDDTLIADDVILDNQIQVAHNVRIGQGTAMAGCVGIAGSATIGSGCLVGGGSGISGHLTIGDNTMVNGMSFVSRDLPSGGHYASGFPVLPTKQWNKLVATMRRLIKKKG